MSENYPVNQRDKQSWSKICEIFDQAVELPPDSWTDFLAAASDDEYVRAEVARLLRHDQQSTGFLIKPLLVSVLKGSGAKPLEAGEVLLDRFVIQRKIGEGGMGQVFEAEDRASFGERVAVKTLLPHFMGSAILREQFRTELLLARKVSHPNICRVHELHELGRAEADSGEQTLLFLTMEYLAGETLAARLRSDRVLGDGDRNRILTETANALAAAHEAGIIHCDLKPGNIFLCEQRDGNARTVVTDFGLARVRGGEGQTATALGTPGYMAPELFACQAAGSRSDVYAFGVIVVEVFTGKPRVPAGSTLTGLSEVNGIGQRELMAVPVGWREIATRCLADDPVKRYGDGGELQRAIELALGSGRGVARRRMLWVSMAAIGSLAGGVAYYNRAIKEPEQGLAILPFEIRGTAEPALAQAIPDELIRTLSQIPQLRIIGRTSSARFAGNAAYAIAQATRFGIGVLLKGTITGDHGRLTITLQFQNGRTGGVIWERQFTGMTSDVVRLREDMANAVAGALPIQLNDRQKASLGRRPTEDAEAFNNYLLASKEASSRTVPGLERSVELYQAALNRDSSFALAASGKSTSLAMLAGRPGYEGPSVLYLAEKAAMEALGKDETLPEAHLAYGAVLQRLHFNWGDAERHYRRAIALNPGFATGHHWLAGLLSNLGQFPEALVSIRRARELEPLALPVNTAYGAILLRARQTAEARSQLEFTAQLSPGYPLSWPLMGETHLVDGNWALAITAFQKAVEQNPGDTYILSNLAHALGRAGRRRDAEELCTTLERKGAAPIALAQAYLGLGRLDDAMDQLNQAYGQRDPRLASLGVEPVFQELRQRADFLRLLKNLGLI